MTTKQIQSQLEAANKRVAKFESRIEMYSGRVLNALVKASKKTGMEVTVENYRDLLQKDNWDLCYSISSPLYYKAENEKYLKREIATIEKLEKELSTLEAALNEQKPLENALRSAMIEFRKVWFEDMISWYDAKYDRLRAKLEYALNRRERAKAARYYFETRHNWREYVEVKEFLNRTIKSCNEIILEDANNMEKPEYLKKVSENLERVWEKGISKLADKCRKFNVDEAKIKATKPVITPKGFEVTLTDGKPRIIDARVIWAAEYSTLVTPHTRYIVTKREK